jgi:FkbM family methyltransferase
MMLKSWAAKAFNKLRWEYKTFAWSILARLRKTVIVRTQQGRFKVCTADVGVGRHLYRQGNAELDYIGESLQLLRKLGLCPPKGQGTVLDIGANIGYIGIGMLYTKEINRVVAVEPEPSNFDLLTANAELNGFSDRIHRMAYAIGPRHEEIDFELSATNYGDHHVRVENNSKPAKPELGAEAPRKLIRVPCLPLDELVELIPDPYRTDISLVWMDVQGYEGFVFASGEKFFSRGIPVVTEIWPYQIAKSGMTQEEFIQGVARHWSSYWVLRRSTFVRYPISVLSCFFDELGTTGLYDNIILTPQ